MLYYIFLVFQGLYVCLHIMVKLPYFFAKIFQALYVHVVYDASRFQGWPEFYLKKLMNMSPDGPNNDLDTIGKLACRMEVCTYSTAFSGVDSPGTALAQLRLAAQSLLQKEVLHPDHLHAVEACSTMKCNAFELLSFVIY